MKKKNYEDGKGNIDYCINDYHDDEDNHDDAGAKRIRE